SGAEARAFESGPGNIRRSKLLIVVLRSHPVCFEYPPCDQLRRAEVHAAAGDSANTVAGIKSIDPEPVVAEQSVDEQSGIVEVKGKFRPDRNGGFVAVPVVAKIAFKSEVLIEVVGQAGSEALRHVGDLG